MDDDQSFFHLLDEPQYDFVERNPGEPRWWWMTQREARWFSAGTVIGMLVTFAILGLGRLVS